MVHRRPTSPATQRRHDISACLDRAYDRGGLTLLVDGLAGMGKTTILRELARQAFEADRWPVTYVTADEVERAEPYAFIGRLLASGLPTDGDLVPDATTQTVPVAQACLRAILAPHGAPGRVIVVDDAQWVDPESVRVLRYVLPRVNRRVLVAIGVRTPHEPGGFGDYLHGLTSGSHHDLHYRAEPLTAPQIQALAVEQFGVGIAARNAEQLRLSTGGSFLAIDSIFGRLTRAEISQLHLAWNIPIRRVGAVDNPLLHRHERMSAPARATAELVCLAGHEISRATLARAARRLGEGVHVEEAIGAGVLSESGFGATIIPAHDLIGHAIAQTVDHERSRAVSRVLADVTDGYRSVMHALRGAEEWTAQLRGQVTDYVRRAVARASYANASRVLRAALDLATDAAVRHDLLVDLALVHLRNNSGYEVLDLLPELEDLPRSLLREFIVVMIGAHRTDQPFPHERTAAMLVPSEDPDELTIQAFLSFVLVIMTMRTADPSPVPGLIAAARHFFSLVPATPEALSDERLAWMVAPREYLVLLDAYELVQLQLGGDLRALASRLPEVERARRAMPEGSLRVDVTVALAGNEVALGRLGRARALAEEATDLSNRVSKAWAAGTVRIILADCMIRQGDLAAATDVLAVIVDLSYDVLDVETRPVAAAMAAIVAAIRGEETAHLLAQARVIDDIAWEGYGRDLPVLAGCEAARALGDPAEILALTSPDRVGGIVNTQHGFLTYRAHALLDLGDHVAAAELIGELERCRAAGTWLEYWGTLAWLRARLAEHHDAGAARAMYEDAVATRDYPLPAALTYIDYGRLLAGQGDASGARRAWDSARAILERLGAGAYLPRVRAALESLADGDRIARSRLVADLTRREHEIAGHLAQGRSNQEIAVLLVVSEATVRFHVSNVLRKLHLSSRAQVARVLHGPGDPA
ncbi:LuxR family transcriptional regulator [Pseudactinotalea sp. HY158]|uniref:helix-turn-helix transcriptional regulator n=1 Tax=Pseudactinotalea sp. HY158 TaxID=2654547 RepID=UPI00129C6B30|nr:LuxR family transcriptional regulator [Pseudactinotalea sp. HY158]QGH69618.1 AAA family ATPase [Pseudactinotalea sp. HY158]